MRWGNFVEAKGQAATGSKEADVRQVNGKDNRRLRRKAVEKNVLSATVVSALAALRPRNE